MDKQKIIQILMSLYNSHNAIELQYLEARRMIQKVSKGFRLTPHGAEYVESNWKFLKSDKDWKTYKTWQFSKS